MVRRPYDQKPYRRSMMETWGARCAEPVDRTRTPGARSSRTTRTRPARSASRSARRSRTPRRPATPHYALGSVLNHVLLHQTVIGQEAKEQLELAGE